MRTFDISCTLSGHMPEGLSPAIWEAALDFGARLLRDTYITFFVPDSAVDLTDGGPVSGPVCRGGSLAVAIAVKGLASRLCDSTGNSGVWSALFSINDYRADVVLIPDSDWVPGDIRQALDSASGQEESVDRLLAENERLQQSNAELQQHVLALEAEIERVKSDHAATRPGEATTCTNYSADDVVQVPQFLRAKDR